MSCEPSIKVRAWRDRRGDRLRVGGGTLLRPESVVYHIMNFWTGLAVGVALGYLFFGWPTTSGRVVS